jgi:hypothetical protein
VKLLLGRSAIGAAALLSVALAGCHHQPKVPPLPPQTQIPNIYIPPPPQPNLPPMQAPPPAVVTDVKPTVKPSVKPRKHKKPPTRPAEDTTTPAPASAPVPAESTASAALGALSPGGDSSPRQQQVAGHIAAVEHRVNELPTPNSDEQKKQVLQVRQFLKQASDALKTGDAEGAENLTTKAGLLLDDIK